MLFPRSSYTVIEQVSSERVEAPTILSAYQYQG
uniref:Uncharacterized protein n=1 Tax=Anguilla anguilla TaxID=7936 RepID=A0A0E9SIL7_ANGAN